MTQVEQQTELTVNGEQVAFDADPRTPLLLVLRNDLGLKGVRCGCGIGECGVCTVLVDGHPVQSCSTPLETVAGCEVTTPEGLGTPEAPHPVQRAFLEEQAGQCGYCINGMMVRVAALCERGSCTDAEAVAALDEHLCRCGTHTRILRATRRALSLQGPAPAEDHAPWRHEAAPPAPDAAPPGPAWTRSDGLPPGIVEHPRVESWLHLDADGSIEVRSGKVEFGQGIRTAVAQIAAAQIGVPTERVRVRPVETALSPDEGYSSGSRSVDHGGAAVGYAGRALARLLVERAADRLGVAREDLALCGDEVASADGQARVTLRELAAAGPVTGRILAGDEPDWNLVPLGEPLSRADLVAKLTGAPAYVHDLDLPRMLHARALLPPSYEASPRSLPVEEVETMPGVVRVVVDGRLVVVIAEREEQAIRAVERLAQDTTWDDPGLPVEEPAPDGFRALPAEPYIAVEPDSGAGSTQGRRLRATYAQPYQAHAAIAPSCGVAQVDGATMRVWSHAQGMHPLRRELAALLGEDPADIEVLHRDGPGTYGHNLADDAAGLAAVAARAVAPRPVRFQFSVTDEFTWEPYGAALLADLEATVDDDGRITDWSHRAITDRHTSRPRGDGKGLLAAWLASGGQRPQPRPPAEPGARNADPPYDIPSVHAVADHVDGPLRTSSLRSLGAFLNVFAGESFMDELAELAGQDPVAFRLAHLTDPHARGVLEAAAEASGWQPHVGPSGRGLGIAVARYKSEKAVVAQAVEVAVDPDAGAISVQRVVTACDAGTVVNADGLVNQLEGGTIQGLSRALHEEVRADRRGIRTRDWTSYPVLRFEGVPTVETLLLSTPGAPPLGAGEAATPPVAAALANAVDDALGVRLRRVPLTPAAFEQRLFELTDEESARVLLA